jgi:hypothetical protein
MVEMYKILGWTGWIWTAVFVVVVATLELVRRARARREGPLGGVRGFEVGSVREHGSDEKQS